ncbi:DUF2147 domain-containing protein [Bradyrhizobium yuanmingense]|uniref:DUF2147 domain-containing protein n=4 Tax=Bradyrhizobium TaxID=374 RepID=UPI001586A925|nr:DUF2147 domain-containing protein [Bradyrhizobium yuanmingense]QCJ91409.1 DUF2147 domain-containing protein [Bradyrhizobium yuanmingense]
MRKLLATAAFLLASTAAQAQYTFEYGGHTIRIDPDRGTVQIPGVYDNTGQSKPKKAKKNETAPQQATVDPQAPAAPAPAPAPAAPPAAVQAAPVQAAVAPPAPAAAPTRDLNSPVGMWLTEEKEGKVRIEQCGTNLCGYSVDSKSNQNGEQVLINMKPGKDQKWSGRILDPNSGSTYDSTIAMKGTDRLRVQGCAFGGMFCGGQTWTRVN